MEKKTNHSSKPNTRGNGRRTDSPSPRFKSSRPGFRSQHDKEDGDSERDERRPATRGGRTFNHSDQRPAPRKTSEKSFTPRRDGDGNAANTPRFENENGERTTRRNHHGKSHSKRTFASRNGEAAAPSTRKGGKRSESKPKAVPQKKEKTPPPTPKPYDGTTRLNKYIANAGICSRREADKLIAAGAVKVNGKIITEMGFQVHEGDVVNYGGESLRSERKRYFLLNKPKGFITTVDDPQERETVMMLMDGACSERIYPVGRLDRNTTGLLLFTNDGDLARRLTHPSTGVYKIYQVELDRPVTREDMRQMLEGIELEDGPIHVDDVQYVQAANDKRVVGVELHSGKNRIVRRIFEHFGYNVHKLDRVVFAGLTKKDLPRGRYRELTEKEVGYLMMI